jgi:cytochrome c biogenesis protein ResB
LSQEKNLTKSLNDFLSSIKLSIFVLVSLAVTSIFGTVIEQGESQAHYGEHYGAGLGKLINLFNLGDMYHSWWFLLILSLLLINITFCSLKRLPGAIKLMNDREPLFDKHQTAVHERFEIKTDLSATEAEEKVAGILSKKVSATVRGEDGGAVYLMASRGGWSRMGVYVTHCSLFLFAVGSIVGILFGFKGFVGIVEGTQQDVVRMRGAAPVEVSSSAQVSDVDALGASVLKMSDDLFAALSGKQYLAGNISLTVKDGNGKVYTRSSNFNEPVSSKDTFSGRVPFLVNKIEWDGSSPIKEITLSSNDFFYRLPFSVRCDEFNLENYPDGRTKDYVSFLTVIRNGTPGEKLRIEVNSPLIVDGIYFYQSSFGQVGVNSANITIADQNRNFLATNRTVKLNERVTLPDGGELILRDAQVDNQRGGASAAVFQAGRGGASDQNVVYEASAFGGQRQWWPVGPYYVRMEKADWVFYTGLQVAKDPGVPIVWIGCFLITIGLVASFFFSHKRVWAKISKVDGKTQILFAGNASRNRVSFENWFEALSEETQETFQK